MRARQLLSLWIGFHAVSAAGAVLETEFWNLDKLRSISAREIHLTTRKGVVLSRVPVERLRALDDMRHRLEGASGISVDIYLASDTTSQVVSGRIATGRNLVCLTLPAFEGSADDPGAFSRRLAREFAHLKLGHEAAQIQNARDVRQVQDAVFVVLALLLQFVSIGPAPSAQAGQSLNSAVNSAMREGAAQGAALGAGVMGATAIAGDVAQSRFTQEQDVAAERLADEWLARIAAAPPAEGKIEPVAATDVASIPGEFKPVTYDAQPRATTLYEIVLCRLPSGAVERLSRLECVRREGESVPAE